MKRYDVKAVGPFREILEIEDTDGKFVTYKDAIDKATSMYKKGKEDAELKREDINHFSTGEPIGYTSTGKKPEVLDGDPADAIECEQCGGSGIVTTFVTHEDIPCPSCQKPEALDDYIDSVCNDRSSYRRGYQDALQSQDALLDEAGNALDIYARIALMEGVQDVHFKTRNLADRIRNRKTTG